MVTYHVTTIVALLLFVTMCVELDRTSPLVLGCTVVGMSVLANPTRMRTQICLCLQFGWYV